MLSPIAAKAVHCPTSGCYEPTRLPTSHERDPATTGALARDVRRRLRRKQSRDCRLITDAAVRIRHAFALCEQSCRFRVSHSMRMGGKFAYFWLIGLGVGLCRIGCWLT
jgi:hypothetical protein